MHIVYLIFDVDSYHLQKFASACLDESFHIGKIWRIKEAQGSYLFSTQISEIILYILLGQKNM